MENLKRVMERGPTSPHYVLRVTLLLEWSHKQKLQADKGSRHNAMHLQIPSSAPSPGSPFLASEQ